MVLEGHGGRGGHHAVTNLPADAFAYEGETVEFVVRNDSPTPKGSPSTPSA